MEPQTAKAPKRRKTNPLAAINQSWSLGKWAERLGAERCRELNRLARACRNPLDGTRGTDILKPALDGQNETPENRNSPPPSPGLFQPSKRFGTNGGGGHFPAMNPYTREKGWLL